jgi:hypothetical protein
LTRYLQMILTQAQMDVAPIVSLPSGDWPSTIAAALDIAQMNVAPIVSLPSGNWPSTIAAALDIFITHKNINAFWFTSKFSGMPTTTNNTLPQSCQP